ncbi:nucleotide sugar dehydrogenase [Frankia sp. AgB1.9]|uniref:nucleotide sugar dehydrogenase n=1 Tax=unclassified Frankia TaxID=2632575 RepID=UPI0019349E19|nr:MULTISPECIES: nucleotide sugar dehydrogenase [unclassified Frankia]MBL7491012.1 nucleotide sugar dehydrogenase [Frankia sp. AgW1.1]MBL7552371.1 nucleotide sugar dehydrogenase [Frankia sp. AgB1.9]MBL7622130.1 nucleotide sugar dehydrogenase [Frankia sp. AgB1.8]
MEELGKLVVVDQGHVGLPLSMRAAEVGWRVVGLDVDEQRVARLATGESCADDVSDAQLRDALDGGRYRPAASYTGAEGFDVAVVTVPTSPREGTPGLAAVTEAARGLAPYLRAGATVILESTTYPGTTEELFGPTLEAGSRLVAGRDFRLGYSPERLDPGNRTWRLANTPKVVSGVDRASLAAVQGFFDTIAARTVPVSSTRAAELAKLVEGAFRQVNIALVNELAMVAGELGVDVWEAIDAAATKPYGFMRFTPGPGVGGQWLPLDPSGPPWQTGRGAGRSLRFLELARDINDQMPDYVVRRAGQLLNDRGRPVRGSRVLLLGLSYKRNTGDVGESPAVRIATLLARLGADVRAADPHVDPAQVGAPVRLVELDEAELAAADLVVVLVDHDLFPRGLVSRFARAVLDTRRWLPPGPAVPAQRRAPDAESLIVPASAWVESL